MFIRAKMLRLCLPLIPFMLRPFEAFISSITNISQHFMFNPLISPSLKLNNCDEFQFSFFLIIFRKKDITVGKFKYFDVAIFGFLEEL